MRNTHCGTWYMARKPKNMQNETKTLFDWTMARNTEYLGKMRNSHLRTWSMVRKPQNMENEKCKLYYLEYGEKP